MRRFVFSVLGALLLMSAPAKAELLVSISKSQQRLAVVVNGAETHRWPVSTGARGYETPSGKFTPIRLERHWYSRKYNMTPMPWSMFFYRGYAVHGTTEVNILGRAASHGCVRLSPDKAAMLFALMRRHGLRNTQVVVMNGALPGQPADGVTDIESSPTEDMAAKSFASVPVEGGSKDFTVSIGDEAKVLRERAAWLQSLDRKYGIVR